MRYRYFICDVFTEERFGGNPLAVFPWAEGLTPELMQKIAREFNFSESTFVFPAEQGHTRRVRIFTPTIEVPFAGHPNIGTAFTLASIGELGEFRDATEILFEEDAGLVGITINRLADGQIECELNAPQSIGIGQSISVERMAHAVGLAPDDLVVSTHLPQEASVGLPFLMAELKDMDALARARANTEALEQLHAAGIVADVHLYVRTEDAFDIRCRMFAPLDNVPEDPATGSANCALVGMLTMLDPAVNTTRSFRIAQGFEMGRPSILNARTEKVAGVVTNVWIGGSCVMFSEGSIDIG